jgi:long-chain acyl-CoA synthetase
MMFSGYFKDPEATSEMFDEAGWLKTGDLGSLDEDGFLSVTGRKKEIIVLSSGKNVPPALVENLVKQNHIVSNVFLYGDGRNYCVALITLNTVETQAFCTAKGIEVRDYAALMNEPAVLDSVAETVAHANSKVSSSEQIKRYTILERDLSQEEGELTPTMKLKRDVVVKNFKAELDALYEDR